MWATRPPEHLRKGVYLQGLDTLLWQATQDGTVPGAVICVAYRGQVVWHQAYGMATLMPQPQPMQRYTRFDMASLTKVIATTSLLLLAHHEGCCRLSDPLARFYPRLADAPLGTVTLRHLLAHCGGLDAWLPLYQTLWPNGTLGYRGVEPQAQRRQAAQLVLQRPLAYAPGSRTVYSDLGFILLADILEQQYHQTLDVLFERLVAQPLGLRGIGYNPLSREAARMAYAATEACSWRQRVLQGEVHDENAWAMGGVAGHAGLFASAEEIWRFAHCLIEVAAGRHVGWLSSALLRDSWQRQEMPVGTTRALGWDTPTPGRSTSGKYFSAASIGHLGFTGCSLWIDLQQQVTVVLCTNRVHPSRQATGIVRLRPQVHNAVMSALGVATT